MSTPSSREIWDVPSNGTVELRHVDNTVWWRDLDGTLVPITPELAAAITAATAKADIDGHEGQPSAPQRGWDDIADEPIPDSAWTAALDDTTIRPPRTQGQAVIHRSTHA